MRKWKTRLNNKYLPVYFHKWISSSGKEISPTFYIFNFKYLKINFKLYAKPNS